MGSKKYDFDTIHNRQKTNAMSTDGFREYLFADEPNLNLNCPDDELIRMWVADMEFGTAPEIIEALQKRLEHPIFGYSQVTDPKFAEAFFNWTKTRYGWAFEKEHLLFSKGVVPALFSLIELIMKPDEKILIMTPSYAFFKHAADANGTELVYSKLIYDNGFYTMNFEDIRKKAADEKVTLCIFCNPHNPTGRVWTENELKQFGEICLKNKVMIISDEIHCDLIRANKKFTPLAKLFPETDQIITTMSSSKTFNLAGFMFANLIIPNDALRENWQQSNFPIDNPLSIVAAQAAYSSGHAWLEELSIYLDENFEFLRDFLAEHLPDSVFTISESTYLAWVNVGAYFQKDENLTLFFANNAGVLLEGGNMFVDNSDGFIRLNLACPRATLEVGLKKIEKAILERNQ